jgi:hypothetical protein
MTVTKVKKFRYFYNLINTGADKYTYLLIARVVININHRGLSLIKKQISLSFLLAVFDVATLIIGISVI